MRITAVAAALIAVAIISAVLIIRYLNDKNHGGPEETAN
jgi:hypothetical protein